MALDVYVGSLTRYYSGEWENIAEKTARERGRQDQAVRSGRATDRLRDPERIQPAVLAWRAALGESLGNNISAPLTWDESPDAPYFTGRPGWDGFGSLVLWAAYAEQSALRCPETLPEEWDNDPALVRSTAEGFRSRYSHLVRNVELWLPNRIEFTFEGEDVDGHRVVVGSATTLRRQLADLNAATWRATEATVADWGRMPPRFEATLELRGRYAFAVFSDLAQHAVDHCLPMKLDY